MSLTPEQIKGRIKNVAKQNNADARVLMRIYMMERFLERVSKSKYSDNFIIKGGILVTSMIGVSLRSTMDIDTTIRNFDLSKEEALKAVKEISEIDLDDNISFEVKAAENIMDDKEYPGIRVGVDATIENMVTPIKIDISTGDVITPRAIAYDYKLMIEDRSIKLWSYNLETIMAEKLQTVLSRGILNTRMRDYYDICTLLMRYRDDINLETFRNAFEATCKKRNSLKLIATGGEIIEKLAVDKGLMDLWASYQRKYPYAEEIAYENAVTSVRKIYELLIE